ncbi:transcript variant X1 [Nothobranchius furzeri]|uniref:Tripartite motif-containing protein 54 n=1 Tax=Nothobranchius furzeri TaxID=105023 RepID=A0A9D3BWF2_NOTFU|nr:transcript variant X1 [Nothobranchius furzeri]
MESLEKQLICPICLEIFTKPVVILPCQHNLCRKCANDVFQASNPYLSTRSGTTVSSGGRFRCPSCRHEVVLDRHGVYGLQRNLLVENIIDMYKQGSTSKPAVEVKLEQPMCEEHEGEKINIYCTTCSVPTCSLCKVFGSHKDCEVAPLNNVFSKQKAELTDCVSMLVGNNERIQAIIGHLDETSRAVDENGRRQKSKVCEVFDHLFALLEERKAEMMVRITSEQEEKLDYIRSLNKKYSEHLEGSVKLLETAIQTMDESEMAVFLQVTLNPALNSDVTVWVLMMFFSELPSQAVKPLLQKLVQATSTSHLDKVQPGYERLDHFKANFETQRRVLMDISFKLDDNEEDSEEDVELQRPQQPVEPAAKQQPPQPPVCSDTPTQNPSELTQTTGHTSSSSSPLSPSSSSSSFTQAPPPLPLPTTSSAPQLDQQNELEDRDGSKHVFSFSWLNQK